VLGAVTPRRRCGRITRVRAEIRVLPKQAAERGSWSAPASSCFARSGTALVTRVRSVRAISVLLSNVYLHYALDLWFERVVKPRLRGEAYLVRYIDDFVLCFQYRADALRVQKALGQRLG
jgi:hypothetical protein